MPCPTAIRNDRIVAPGFAPSGQPIELAGMNLWRFRGGHECQLGACTDLNAVARQIGALPPPGSAGEHLGVLLQRLAARKKRRQAHPGMPATQVVGASQPRPPGPLACPPETR